MLGRDQIAIIAAVVLVSCLAAVFAGCGDGMPSAKTEARLAAAFGTVQCDGRAISAQTEQKEKANFRSIVRKDRKLPRVAKLVSDGHAVDKLQAAIRKAAKAPGYKPGALRNDFALLYRLKVKFYADEKALGFPCIGPPHKPIGG